MRIISYITHTPHQYDIANALYDSQMDLIGDNWNREQRPVPENVHFLPNPNDVPLSLDYDVALLHMGGETEPPQGLMDLFQGRVPILLICHGSPEPYMTDSMEPYNPIEIVRKCRGERIIHCNEKDKIVWEIYGADNATWIWHGMKEEFKQCHYEYKRPIIVNSGGWEYMNNVPLLSKLHDDGVAWLQKDIIINNFEDYILTLSQYNIYISGTRYSSFPRSRAEAMHTGMCVLTTNNWDEDKFIQDGANGFFINDNPDDIMALVNSLDIATIKRVGLEGQRTARVHFGTVAYRRRWLEEINYVTTHKS